MSVSALDLHAWVLEGGNVLVHVVGCLFPAYLTFKAIHYKREKELIWMVWLVCTEGGGTVGRAA